MLPNGFTLLIALMAFVMTVFALLISFWIPVLRLLAAL